MKDVLNPSMYSGWLLDDRIDLSIHVQLAHLFPIADFIHSYNDSELNLPCRPGSLPATEGKPVILGPCEPQLRQIFTGTQGPIPYLLQVLLVV